MGRRLEDEGWGWLELDAWVRGVMSENEGHEDWKDDALLEPQDMDDAIRDHRHRDTKPGSTRMK